ncbi:hypothetical protein [Sphingobium sp. CCH11-B1]|jgi:hypothetical protein|uniref:hypothetical protein n=1 Tax=Sphingobium sp. CCH11-B1 TaxID=1768781 RepID=UPI0018D24E45|nr:hypothetical protein [Sphingobium sp. CCH11-B1]|tara:strand:- start:2739 stop:2933 length:195 start_codon:yes stop_codon:yes gene_type:complete
MVEQPIWFGRPHFSSRKKVANVIDPHPLIEPVSVFDTVTDGLVMPWELVANPAQSLSVARAMAW